MGTWRDMKRDAPATFGRAVDLERHLNGVRDELGRDHVFLTRYGIPLDEAVVGVQGTFDFEGPEGCDDGFCWT